MLKHYLQHQEDTIPVNRVLESEVAQNLFTQPVHRFSKRSRWTLLFSIPIGGLAVVALLLWQVHRDPATSFIAQAQEVYEQDLQDAKTKIFHSIKVNHNASGETVSTFERWIGQNQTADMFYTATGEQVYKTITFFPDSLNGDVTYTQVADQTTISRGSGSRFGETCQRNGTTLNQNVDELVDPVQPDKTVTERTDILKKILQNQNVTDLGEADGLHGFRIIDERGDNTYYLDATTAQLKTWVIRDLATGEVIETDTMTVNEFVEPGTETEAVFTHPGTGEHDYTLFIESYGDQQADGCYQFTGQLLDFTERDHRNDTTITTADPRSSDATETEETAPVICPSANCVNEG